MNTPTKKTLVISATTKHDGWVVDLDRCGVLRRKMNAIEEWGLIQATRMAAFALLVGAASMLIGCAEKPVAKPAPVPVVQPPVAAPKGARTVSVSELCEAYDKNRKAADEQYLEKRINLSGEVVQRGTSLNTHFLYLGPETSPLLDEPENKCAVRCEFPQSAYNALVTLDAGKHVSVTGRVAGKLGDSITLRDCGLR